MSKQTTKPSNAPDLKRVIFGNGGNALHAQDLHQQIARRAYELYRERGGGDGRADEDWFRAEREVCGQPDQLS